MNVTVDHREGEVAVVALSGRLDLVTAAETKQRLTQVVQAGSPRLIADLQGLSFMDSSGLSSLVSALKVTRQAGGDLRLARVPEQARLVLELTTLDRILKPFPSVEEALQGYGGQTPAAEGPDAEAWSGGSGRPA